MARIKMIHMHDSIASGVHPLSSLVVVTVLIIVAVLIVVFHRSFCCFYCYFSCLKSKITFDNTVLATDRDILCRRL